MRVRPTPLASGAVARRNTSISFLTPDTVMKLTNAYAMLVNGGKRITPSLIDRIQDRHGKTI